MSIHFARRLALALAAMSMAAAAQTAAEPYPVEVWADVLFGADGKPTQTTLIDEARYPAKFAEAVKARLARAKIAPPESEGRAATLRSGVLLDFVITPGADGGTVRLSGLAMAPLPLRRYYASFPTELAAAEGWQGEVVGVCTVGVQGRCTAITVKALPGMPESVRRYAKASLEGWTFAPQEVDGKPVEGEFVLRIQLNTLDSAPEDFRQDKFQRLLQKR